MRESIIQSIFIDVSYLWRHRKGNEIPAALQDVIDVLWKDNKPLITKKIKQVNGWFFIINLPPGRSFAEFKSKENFIIDATGGAVQIEKKKKAVYVTVLTEELRGNYPYDWKWSDYEKMSLPVPFGHSPGGLLVRDLSKAPNLLIAGTPGSGKSNFLHVVAVSLLQSRDIYLCVIDRKKLEFQYLRDHALVVTNTADSLNLLIGINKQLDKRADELIKANVVKIQDYKGKMPFIVLIIDELAELDNKECQEQLNRICRLGRALGICVVAATQRPSSSMFKKWGDSKAMFSATVCFHVRDEVNSRMLLDNNRASLMPNVPGRAIFQWDVEIEMQAMYLSIEHAKRMLKGIKGVHMSVIKPQKKLLPR